MEDSIYQKIVHSRETTELCAAFEDEGFQSVGLQWITFFKGNLLTFSELVQQIRVIMIVNVLFLKKYWVFLERRERNINVYAFLLTSFFFVLTKIHRNFMNCLMNYASFCVFLRAFYAFLMVRDLLFPFVLFRTRWWRRWWGIRRWRTRQRAASRP